jgi:hypothetical protein
MDISVRIFEAILGKGLLAWVFVLFNAEEKGAWFLSMLPEVK